MFKFLDELLQEYLIYHENDWIFMKTIEFFWNGCNEYEIP